MQDSPAIKKPVLFFTALAGAGFIDATYLTVQHYLGAIPPCFVADGCSVVLTSKWSEIAGVPIALLGALMYLALLVLSVIYLRTKNIRALAGAVVITGINFIVSVFLVSLQLFVIEQICFYCMVSAVISTGLFATGIFIFSRLRARSSVPENLQP